MLREEDPAHPRNALPLTDGEIRALYWDAVAHGEVFLTPEEPEAPAWSRYVDVGVYALVGLLMVPVSPFILLLLVMMVGLLLLSGANFIGLVSYWAYEGQRGMREGTVDVTDKAVLEAVVKHISAGPLNHHRRLKLDIQRDRQQIASSLTSLTGIVETLQAESASSEIESLRVLIDNRIDVARSCVDKLHALEGELAQQQDEADLAIKPIVEIKTRFDKLTRVAHDLAAIQAAHGLIDDTQQAVIDHRLQIQLLRQVSASAIGRLGEIERLVRAHEQAKDEVASLQA